MIQSTEEFSARLRSAVRLDDLHSQLEPEQVLSSSRRAQRRGRLAASTTAAFAVLAAIALGVPMIDDVQQPAEPPVSTADGDLTDGGVPIDLINLWRVTDAAGESEDTWLRIDTHQFQLWRGDTLIFGDWDATDRVFLAHPYGASGPGVDMTIQWLAEPVALHRDHGGWELVDESGRTVATLTLDGAPEPIPTAADFFAEPPVVNDETREALQPPRPLPAGLTPATPEAIAGRWVPASAAFTTDPHIALEPDGTWTGSDGCNLSGGVWAVTHAARLLATFGGSTQVGCPGELVPSWLSEAARAGFDGDVLVLVSRDGTELGRLRRD